MKPASDGHKDIVELLIAEGANVNAKSRDGYTPLDKASSRKRTETFDLLRKHGGKTRRELIIDEYSIHTCVGIADVEAVKKRLADGVDVNAKGDAGFAPLHVAVVSNRKLSDRKKIVELLLSNGADVNAKDDRGSTALHLAEDGDKEIVELLLSNGADVNAKDDRGGTPLHNAAFLKGHKTVAELLIEKGADVNALGFMEHL